MSLSSTELLDVLSDIGLWTTFPPILIGLIFFRSLRPSHWCVVMLAFCSVSADLLTRQFRGDLDVSTAVSRIFTVAEFTLISFFFFFEFSKKITKSLVVVFNLAFVAVAVLDFFLQGAMQMDTLSLGLESVTFLIYSLLFFYFAMREMAYPNILKTTQFWIISGILLYFGGSIFIFISSNYLSITSMELFDRIWSVHNMLMIAYNVLISVGLWKARKQYL